ncbi:hypothetical protein GJ496_010647 [Pomphorhynchus laevis]|nr:hypothetical protein GJ496_010647 [Pomphorhynchus laevis]
MNSLISDLGNNPYFGAGFGLFGLALLSQAGRYALRFTNIWFRRRYVTSLEITSLDRCYPWLLQYLSKQSSSLQFALGEDGKSFIPSTGVHLVRESNGTFIRVERNREKIAIPGGGAPFEILKLTALGNHKNTFKELIDRLNFNELLASQKHQYVYTPYLNNEWKQFGLPRAKRSLDSVILKNNLVDTILDDLKKFLESAQWYHDTGIPYRRGYLFYGPPGCGKSSLIFSLAGNMNRSICSLNLGERTMTDDRLNQLLNNAPSNSVISLEDVDAIISNQQTINSETDVRYIGMNPLSLNGLLNALDGVASAADGRVVFMTTNFYEKLPSVLIRPGRVDFKAEITYAGVEQIYRMCNRFFPRASNAELEELKGHLIRLFDQSDLLISPAELQGYFMNCKNMSCSIQNLGKLVNISKKILPI